MPLVNFSEAELLILREMARRVMGGSVNTFGRGRDLGGTWEDVLGPETYVAKTPSGGIPGLVSGDTGTGTGSYDEPGSADCDIYCIDESDATPDLRDIDLDQPVYNVGETAIAGSTYVVVCRDKFGHWLAHGGGGGDSRRRFKLKTALAEDGSATAYLVEKVGSVLVATATEFTVWDGMSEFSGAAGTLGLAEWWSDMDRWEVYQMACAVSDSGTGTGTP